jgi:hypothetical protein
MNKCLQIVVVLLIAAGFFAGVFKRMMEISIFVTYVAVVPKQQLDSKESTFRDLVFQLKKVAFAQAGGDCLSLYFYRQYLSLNSQMTSSDFEYRLQS